MQKLKRVLDLIHHEYSDATDEFWHFAEGTMTVFGFGRGPREISWQQLTEVPTHLTIGFAEDGRFTEGTKVINSAYQELVVSVGRPALLASEM